MTVREFIDFLQQQPPDILVAYEMFSEQCLLEPEDIKIVELCLPRKDGWIQDYRPDKETRKYLLIPGN